MYIKIMVSSIINTLDSFYENALNEVASSRGVSKKKSSASNNKAPEKVSFWL